ncbi:uncharacterized protein [Miscanthus floridulus]|uniref:uncharacterized protein n=1 Tax=Miscanthus floridulus TaxID=154761 RepID=UPI0034579BCC
MLDLSALTIEDVTDRLWVVDERLKQATATKDSGRLLLIEEWAARRNSGVASSSRGGDGKRHGKASFERKKQVDPNACRRCRKMGHWVRECPNRKQEKAKAHLAQADDEDEVTILMATFCALHDVEAEEKVEVTAVEGPGMVLKAINLDEPRAQVHLGRVGADQEQRWYLDSGASNHMTGSKAAFSELDDDVTGTRRLPFLKATKYRATDALELVRGDLCGLITPGTNGGRWYFLLLVDDYSRYMWLQLLMSKDEAVATIKKFKMRAEAESDKKLRVLRADRGGEFASVEFVAYCADQDMVRHHTAPYSPQQNDVVERRNQTVVGMA